MRVGGLRPPAAQKFVNVGVETALRAVSASLRAALTSQARSSGFAGQGINFEYQLVSMLILWLS